MKNRSYVRQDNESYEKIVGIALGSAEQLKPDFPGDIKLSFPESRKIVTFDWVSSVMFCDELLWSPASYPYFPGCGDKNGLFKVVGSSYLKRIQTMGAEEPVVYLDHHHFIYFDREFNWHITARGVDITSV